MTSSPTDVPKQIRRCNPAPTSVFHGESRPKQPIDGKKAGCLVWDATRQTTPPFNLYTILSASPCYLHSQFCHRIHCRHRVIFPQRKQRPIVPPCGKHTGYIGIFYCNLHRDDNFSPILRLGCPCPFPAVISSLDARSMASESVIPSWNMTCSTVPSSVL